MNTKSDNSWLFSIVLIIILGLIIGGIATDKFGLNILTDEKKVEVESITLNQNNIDISVGETTTILVELKPNGSKANIVWESSNTDVATVSDGKVKAVHSGTATITAKVNNEVKAQCLIVVNDNLSENNNKNTKKDSTNNNNENNKKDNDNKKQNNKNNTNNTNTNSIINPKSISLDKNTLSIKIDETANLFATIKPNNVSDDTVIWTSSDSSIVSVKNGEIKGLKVGKATITATTTNKLKSSCIVTVNPINIKSIEFKSNEESILVGGKTTLALLINPENATNKTITWTSSDKSIATVNNGIVTGIKLGNVTITAKVGDKTAKATVHVISKEIPIQSISITPNGTSTVLNKPINLTAVITPSNATNKNVVWSSSDTTIATVDNNGLVNPKKIGSVNITAKVGSKSATVKVTVNPIKVTGVSLDKTSLSILVGSSSTLTATVSPSNATNKGVTWKSSNTSIATVDQNGKVTAKTNGTAVITVTTKDGNYSKSATVTVNSIAATSITLNKTSLTLTEGSSGTLVATILPSNATNKTVTWITSDATIVTVSTTGVVTAKKPGTATITAKTNNGKTASCTVKVNAKPVHKIHFIKTGDSDSILIESNGHYGLVDAASSGTKTVEYLKKIGVKYLDFVIATHHHHDHIGGIPTVANNGFITSKTTYYYRIDDSRDSKPYEADAINAAKNKGAKLQEVTNKYPIITLGSFKIEIMNSEKGYADEKNPKGEIVGGNKNSLVAYVTINNKFGTLLAGDVESQDEYRLISKLSNKPVDVLKVAHHSWQSSTTMKFTKSIKPKYAVVTGKYLLDDISTPVYYMQQKYGTKFYLTQSSDDAVVVDYSGSSLKVTPSKSLVSNYTIKKSTGKWRQLQNGIWFYINDGSNLDTIVYDKWIKENETWYYLGLQGNMMTGWIEVNYKGNPELFYLSTSGKMLTGWQQAKGYSPYNNDKSDYYKSYMYSHVNGLIDGWYRYSDTWANGKNWFYFDPNNGVMYRNKTATINGKSYTFNKNGICTNC